MIRSICGVLLWGLAAGAWAGEGPQRLEAFLADLRSLASKFEQTLFDERLELLESSQGEFLLLRPGRFRWDYSLPYEQAIVGDGERVWIYDSELEQVTVRPIDAALGATPAVLLSSDRPLREDFEVADLGSRGELAWVGLTPRSPDAGFTDIRLAFDAEQLRMMELVDQFGQITQLRFAEVRRNPDLDPAAFRFSPPPGTDVLEEHQQ